MEGWKLHTHSDHRGQKTLDAELLPTHGSRSSSHSPSCGRQHCSWSEHREIRWSPQGSKPQCICVSLKKTFPGGGGAEVLGPSWKLFRQTAPSAAQACTCLGPHFCAHTATAMLHFPLARSLPATGHPAVGGGKPSPISTGHSHSQGLPKAVSLS